MLDPRGDPTLRVIDGETIETDYAITHDYYDHRDADRDLNVVFPITRLKEMQAAGTIGISINRPYTASVKPPRTIYRDWPFGHPLGEPGHVAQQTAVLNQAFEALYTIDRPGTIIDVGWHWGRETYPQPFRSTRHEATDSDPNAPAV